MAEKFPEMPESHIVVQWALDLFQYLRPQEWIVTPSIRDYGWDQIRPAQENVVSINTGGVLSVSTKNIDTATVLGLRLRLFF